MNGYETSQYNLLKLQYVTTWKRLEVLFVLLAPFLAPVPTI